MLKTPEDFKTGKRYGMIGTPKKAFLKRTGTPKKAFKKDKNPKKALKEKKEPLKKPF